MNACVTTPVRFTAHTARWLGCLLGTALVLMLAVLAVGNQPPLTLLVEPKALSLLLMTIGFLFAWRRDLFGGIVSLIGIGCFYIFNYAATGVWPGGWVFPLCFIPGVLCVIAWLLRLATREKPQTNQAA